jgi:two-component system nitrogen regulation sensor histidine kinase NtrY
MDPQERKKRRRERIIILILIPLIAFLIYLEGRLFKLDINIGLSNSVLFFILLNINIILLLLLIFLVFRNLVKLIAERRKGIIGSKIRTKLVILFISLAMLPTLVLFGISVKFALSALNYWVNLHIERVLDRAIEVGKFYYEQIAQRLLTVGEEIKSSFIQNGQLTFKLRQKIDFLDIDFIQIYDQNNHIIWTYTKGKLQDDLRHLNLQKGFSEAIKKKQPINLVESLPGGDLVYAIFPLFSQNTFLGILIVGKLIPAQFVQCLEEIRKSADNYKQLAFFIRPLKTSIFLIFSIITLLVLFAATWIGFHMAKIITAPIQALAAATQQVAKGDLNVQVEIEASDELGMLVDSFNRMIIDLKTAYGQLSHQKTEIERRHKYIETLLENIKTGVISTDSQGYITTINPMAINILGESILQCKGKHLNCLASLSPALKKVFLDLTQKEAREKQIRLILNRRQITLLINGAVLKDKKGQLLGYVFVFEDITELEKMQRMAAWQEVARRIAHEIKNPLTPIQLSAQRLRRRYLEKIKDEGVFDECTQMIIKQVEELKHMVNEFSQFARLPAINPTPNDLVVVIEEAVSIYKNAHPHIKFSFKAINSPPIFAFDREQIKRALINLLDNAVDSIKGEGEVEVILSYDESLKIVRIEIKDTGKGIPPELKPYLFEPYFSTKKTGTGLGLTIVHRIISDHQGFIRIKDNQPQGTIFIIELPVRS